MSGEEKLSDAGLWKGYFKTGITDLPPGKILIRGYPLEELMGNISFAEVLYLILKGELPSKEEGKLMEAVLFGIVDHGFLSSASPPARYVVSGNPDPIHGIVSGVLSIGHFTGSPRASGEMLKEAYQIMKSEKLSIGETAKRIITKFREKKKRIPGLGHPLYTIDPRAARLRELAERYGKLGEYVKLMEAIHDEFVKTRGKEIPINTDGMMAAVMAELGFDPLEMEALGVVSYLPGIIGHTIEELKTGQIVRIIPPVITQYTGPAERHLPKERIKED
ncbi:MAG: citryl-CoA lyase [Candidatus Jordarchaeum sp.]|uniref:citryl-CoA lyase n=1 Tax=Candidatus Jordarchaeum sp. TaxID=2823881 RepID=UPI00404AA715